MALFLDEELTEIHRDELDLYREGFFYGMLFRCA